MVSQKDIYTSALLLIRQHGDKAEEVVAEKMRAMMEKDDVNGAGAWLAIGQAIEDLNAKSQQGKLH